MNGANNLFDTNAIIEFFRGEESLGKIYHETESVGISIISRIEYMSFSGLTKEDKDMFQSFSEDCIVFDLSNQNQKLIDLTIKLRIQYSLKLPDALIASQAILNGFNLVSSDKGFKKIQELSLIDFKEASNVPNQT
ncbi:MAG: type II toxin-antitoxin system VapC family toxin [Leptospiraceae bacterium]|nr:type II toxin-antitoxin system VapC family toxin [Leptospiraceae bacterium]MCP5497276.1 type II toxin-antitoxin system VapC family toxin [Leptospiraceae bacterium]